MGAKGGIVRDTDKGYAALAKRLYGAQRARIEVGILSGKGAEEPAHRIDGVSELLTLLQVAIFNEFGTLNADGTEHVPERSFIRGWWDENEPQLRADLTKLMQSVVAGKRTKEQILELMGTRCVGQIQQRIADGIAPENADSTVERKGSSTPLIASGQLRAGVSFRITAR